MADLFRHFFDGYRPLRASLLNRLAERLRLRRSYLRDSGAGPIAAIGRGHTTILRAGQTIGGVTDQSLAAAALLGNQMLPPVWTGLRACVGSNSFKTYSVEPGFDPYTSGDSLLERSLTDRRTASHGQSGNLGTIIGGYSCPGLWGSGARRVRWSLGFCVYFTGITTGGTYRLGFADSWTSPISPLVNPASAVNNLPAFRGGGVVGSAAGSYGPYLLILTQDNAALSLTSALMADGTNLLGGVDALGRPVTVSCALVAVPRSPGSHYHLIFGGSWTGGAMSFTWRGHTTTAIPTLGSGLPSAAAVQAALEVLPVVGAGNVVVTPHAVADGVYHYGPSTNSTLDTPAPRLASVAPASLCVQFIGPLTDVSLWNYLYANSDVLTGGTATPPTVTFCCNRLFSPRAAAPFVVSDGDNVQPVTVGEYWDDAANYANHSLLSLGGSATQTESRQPLEYGYPGGWMRWGDFETTSVNSGWVVPGYAPAQVRRKYFQIDRDGAHLSLSRQSLFHTVGSPGDLNSQPSLAIQTTGFDDHSTTAAPVAATGAIYRPHLQHATMAPARIVQPCVIADRSGRPVAVADGYFFSPRHTDRLADSAHGNRGYFCLGVDPSVPRESYRIGSTMAPVLRNKSDTVPLPQITPVSSDLIGATLGQNYLNTVTWNVVGVEPYPEQDRTIDKLGRSQLGNFDQGCLKTGPTLGITYSRTHFRPVSFFPTRSCPLSAGYIQNGRICWWPQTALGTAGTASYKTQHLNAALPQWLTLHLEAPDTALPGQTNPCMGAIDVQLNTPAVDINGYHALGVPPENNPAPLGVQSAMFGTGICYHGSADVCDGTLHFVLSIATNEFLDNGELSGRLYVFWNAIPPWPPTHLIALLRNSMLAPSDSVPIARVYLLPPGLVGISNRIAMQRPLEGAALAGSWQLSVPLGAAGDPAGVRGVCAGALSASSGPVSYPLAEVGSNCDFTGVAFTVTDLGVGVGFAASAMRQWSGSFGYCCSVGNLKLTLMDSSGGIFGVDNLFSRFAPRSAAVGDAGAPHLIVWFLTDLTHSYEGGAYALFLMPNTEGSFSAIVARYNASFTGQGISGNASWLPLNDYDAGQMTGPLVWNGSCSTFGASGSVVLDEPGVGKARIDVHITV